MRSLIVLAALMLLVTGAAMADTFTFSFIGVLGSGQGSTYFDGTPSPTVISAGGILQATPDGGGEYTVTSGSGTYSTGGQQYGLTLVPNPAAPDPSINNAFEWDDLIFPSQKLIVDNNGLLFNFGPSAPPGSSGGLNIYSYSLDPAHPYNAFIQYGGVNQDGTFTLTAVSEPGETALLIVMLAGAAGLAGVLKMRLA